MFDVPDTNMFSISDGIFRLLIVVVVVVSGTGATQEISTTCYLQIFTNDLANFLVLLHLQMT